MKNWIVCLKHGSKYSHEYVNKLYSMVSRNSTIDYEFACITEDPLGLNSNIVHIPLPNYKLQGWWFKSWIFSQEFPLTGTILFMDLDIVIIDNIDELWNYNPGEFCIIRDFVKVSLPSWSKFNSSIIRFQSQKYSYIWDNLVTDLDQIHNHHGDQEWLYHIFKDNYSFFPDSWIQSYKWQIRDRKDILKIGNKLLYNNIINPIIPDDTRILVFHGLPKPEDVMDPIIVNNWK